MMQKTILAAMLMLLMPVLSHAASRVAVLSPMQAVINTDYVQSRRSQLQDELKGKEAHAKKLAGQLKALQRDLKKNGMTMGKKEKKKKQSSFTTKNMEFQSLQKSIQKRVKTDQQDILQTVRPKLVQAVKAFAKKHDIDVVMNAQAVVYVKPDMDITKAMTKALNDMHLK